MATESAPQAKDRAAGRRWCWRLARDFPWVGSNNVPIAMYKIKIGLTSPSIVNS